MGQAFEQTFSQRIHLPRDVSRIIKTLQAAGQEAFAVGGCVRDCILGKEPDDWDITTSALPGQVKNLFPRTVDTGIQHGTVTVLLGGRHYEVTTYRMDGRYEDGRHPKDVTFVSSLEEDLKRRDFTVNAMAYNEESGLVDLYGGLDDIGKGVLRCVGDPEERFREDALRMMRAVRFSAQLGYRIESQTRQAIQGLAETLHKVSVERIAMELWKLVAADYPERILEAWETGLTAVFFPEFDRMMETPQNNAHHSTNVGMHCVRAMQSIAPERSLRLAALLHDAGKPCVRSTDANGIDHFYGHAQESARLAELFLRRLKADHLTMDRVLRLVRAHDQNLGDSPAAMRRSMNRIGTDLMEDLFALKQADLCAQSDYRRQDKQAMLDAQRTLYDRVVREKDCVSLQDLAVNGKDLIAAGMQPGKELGGKLRHLLEWVMEDPGRNTRERLLQEAFLPGGEAAELVVRQDSRE